MKTIIQRFVDIIPIRIVKTKDLMSLKSELDYEKKHVKSLNDRFNETLRRIDQIFSVEKDLETREVGNVRALKEIFNVLRTGVRK